MDCTEFHTDTYVCICFEYTDSFLQSLSDSMTIIVCVLGEDESAPGRTLVLMHERSVQIPELETCPFVRQKFLLYQLPIFF